MAGHDNDTTEHPESPLNPYDEQTQERIERETERRAQDPIAGRGEFKDVDEASLEAGYELKDVNLGGLLRAAGALVVFTIAALVASAVVLGWYTGELDFAINGNVAPSPEGDVPERIESRRVEGVEYQYWRLTQTRKLESYGWVDEEGGATHIPVDRAMELMLQEEAFPARAEASTDPLVDDRARTLRFSANDGYSEIQEELQRAIEEIQHNEHAEDGEE